MAIPSASMELVLMFRKRCPAYRTIEGWARSMLLGAGGIGECEEWLDAGSH
jgi:hypothetical protein